jgi:hypothetical protein
VTCDKVAIVHFAIETAIKSELETGLKTASGYSQAERGEDEVKEGRLDAGNKRQIDNAADLGVGIGKAVLQTGKASDPLPVETSQGLVSGTPRQLTIPDPEVKESRAPLVMEHMLTGIGDERSQRGRGTVTNEEPLKQHKKAVQQHQQAQQQREQQTLQLEGFKGQIELLAEAAGQWELEGAQLKSAEWQKGEETGEVKCESRDHQVTKQWSSLSRDNKAVTKALVRPRWDKTTGYTPWLGGAYNCQLMDRWTEKDAGFDSWCERRMSKLQEDAVDEQLQLSTQRQLLCSTTTSQPLDEEEVGSVTTVAGSMQCDELVRRETYDDNERSKMHTSTGQSVADTGIIREESGLISFGGITGVVCANWQEGLASDQQTTSKRIAEQKVQKTNSYRAKLRRVRLRVANHLGHYRNANGKHTRKQRGETVT